MDTTETHTSKQRGPVVQVVYMTSFLDFCCDAIFSNFRIYLLRVCKKCVIALSRHSLAKRELIKKLKLEIERRATHSGVDLTFVLSQLTRLQAIQRGRMARSKFAEIKISKLYAIQVKTHYIMHHIIWVFMPRHYLEHSKLRAWMSCS